MQNRNIKRGLFIVLAGLSVLLALDLFVFNMVVLPTMRWLLNEGCRGETLPIIKQIFQSFVPNAEQICHADYQDKLTYAYKALRIPLLSLAAGVTILAWQISRHQNLKASLKVTPHRLYTAILWILYSALSVYVQLGSYVRFMADDYCIGAESVTRGIIGAAIFWYKTWVSRYTTNLIVSIEGALGPRFVPFYPALILVALILSTAFLVRQMTGKKSELNRLNISFLLSTMIVFTTLQTTLDLPQSLYWASAMLNMIPPLLILTFCGGFVLRGAIQRNPARFGWKWFLLAGLLAFVAGGFSEAFTALQVGVWGLALFSTIRMANLEIHPGSRGVLVALFIGSLAALAAHIAAPGFEGRLAGDYRTIEHSILTTFPIAFVSTLTWLKWAFFSWHRGLSMLGLLLLSLLASARYFGSNFNFISAPSVGRRSLILLIPTTFILVYACFVPGAYATAGPPPGRHLIIPAYVLALSMAMAGAILGKIVLWNRMPDSQAVLKNIGVITMLLVLVTSVQAMRGQLRLLRGFARYQEVWDANEILIRSAVELGDDHVTITPLPGPWWNVNNRDIGPDPNTLTNQCASRYYGIEITAQDPLE